MTIESTMRASDTTPPVVEVRQISKSYGKPPEKKLVIADVSLSVCAGEFVSIVGPSGIGKTTLLRCLSGLVAVSGGEMVIAGKTVSGPPPEIAMVFQDYNRSLMPWMHIDKNVALPLQASGVKRKEAHARAQAALDSVGLADAGGRYPWQLSGGMQQRAAIARAIAYAPHILLMDEPFASVDAQTRLDLEDLIHVIHRDYGMTILFVTHDIDEAVYLSDRIFVLGGPPARVVETITVELGPERDQLTTRAIPAFANYRSQILSHIYKNKNVAAPTDATN